MAAPTISYTINRQQWLGGSRGYMINATISMTTGDYATGGLGLTKASLGCPTTITSMTLDGPADTGYVGKYDSANEKLKIYYGNYDSSDGPLIEHPASALAAATVWTADIVGY